MKIRRIHFYQIKEKAMILLTKIMAKRGEKISLHRKKNVYKDIQLTKEEIKKINSFYRDNFGKTVSFDWHRLYKGYTGKFDARYIPDYIYSGYIEPRWNKKEYAVALSDKNLQSIVFSQVKDVRIPNTYVKCINGLLMNNNSEQIDFDKAYDILRDSGETIIKKTVDTDSGRDVQLYDLHDGYDLLTKKKLTQILSSLSDNYVAQECIKPLPILSQIYSQSINTFRVISYIWNSQFIIAPIGLRIGRNGSKVDNIHAGGIMIAVHDDGSLEEYALSVTGERFYKHPDTGTVFKDIKFDFIDRIKEAAIALHKRIPELGIISWDLTIDKNGNLVLIESNTWGQAIWLTQSIHGVSFFGENTASILHSLQ